MLCYVDGGRERKREAERRKAFGVGHTLVRFDERCTTDDSKWGFLLRRLSLAALSLLLPFVGLPSTFTVFQTTLKKKKKSNRALSSDVSCLWGRPVRMSSRVRRSVRGSSKAPKRVRSAGERARVPSIRDVYVKKCAESGIHPNSGLIEMLPDKPGVPFPEEALDVSSNYLGDKGVVPLLAAVEKMPNLRALVLSENGLRNKGMEAICAVAMKHPGLEYLDVSDNYISEGAAQSLEKLLRGNPRIVEVVFENSKIDVEWRVKLKDLIAVNRLNGTASPTAKPE